MRTVSKYFGNVAHLTVCVTGRELSLKEKGARKKEKGEGIKEKGECVGEEGVEWLII